MPHMICLLSMAMLRLLVVSMIACLVEKPFPKSKLILFCKVCFQGKHTLDHKLDVLEL